MNIKDWFYDVAPFQRRSAVDWILPGLAGMGFGLAVGVGIGLLYAPSTGEEARLRLREGASRMRERASDLAAKAKNQITASAEQARGELIHS
jgi:gas vesicle protein